MVRAPSVEAASSRLSELLGTHRCQAIEEVLITRAVAWANEVAGSSHVAYEPAGDGGELRALLGPDVEVFPQNGAGPLGRLANAAARALAGCPGPLLIAWPELAGWRPEHAEAALGDLREGCTVSLGPVFDGGFYLVAVANPRLAVLASVADARRRPDAIGIALGAAHAAGIEVGLLRAERGLHSPGDVRAALADPLLDAELRRLLRDRYAKERARLRSHWGVV